MKKALIIFGRDLKVSYRDLMSLFMIFIPIIMAVAVNLLAPGIQDTTVNLAVIKGENPEMVAYLRNYARVQELPDYDAVKDRVLKRDNFVGITGKGAEAVILAQGNEPQDVIDYAKMLKTFFEYGRQPEDSTTVLKEFGVKTPPIKMLWANMGILLTTVLAGMLISLNIVDEKMDNTVGAINVAPISRTAWMFGKSLIGISLALLGSAAMVCIMGVAGNVNFAQLMIFVFISSLTGIIIGFLGGISSSDVMTAVASTKMILFPLAASITGSEFLGEKWQWVLYWSPFYWIYKGNIAILNGDMTFLNLLKTGGIVLGINALLFAYAAPRIRKGLE